ncbi:MAG TPA: cytochrome P450 [Polyangiales bacterium]|nr:cytochrome P450 [Polyangiales bacterium]
MDVYDLDTYQRAIPHEVFGRLRKESPVYFNAEPKGPGFWAITKYADVVMISKDPKTFSSARGGTNLTDLPPEELSVVQMMMVNMDPPKHNRFRNLVSKGFTPRMIAQLEPLIRAAAKRTVDAVAKQGECDFVRSIAGELPLVIIADLLGIPQSDRDKVFDWSNRLIGFDDPEFQTSFEDGKIAAAELWMYANGLAAQRRAKPELDLTSVLVHAEIDGEKLSEPEFDGFFLMLAVAGNETTRNAISGGTLALMQHPEQRQRLIDDPSLIPSAIEEILRWVTPVIHFRRTLTRDFELRGQKMREGDKVAIFYPSANHDEEVFTDPHEFDVGRTPNEHLSFGVGQHFCLGASLARLELRIIFEELLKRLPDLELAGEARRLRSNFINGIKTMPVRFTPEVA